MYNPSQARFQNETSCGQTFSMQLRASFKNFVTTVRSYVGFPRSSFGFIGKSLSRAHHLCQLISLFPGPFILLAIFFKTLNVSHSAGGRKVRAKKCIILGLLIDGLLFWSDRDYLENKGVARVCLFVLQTFIILDLFTLFIVNDYLTDNAA